MKDIAKKYVQILNRYTKISAPKVRDFDNQKTANAYANGWNDAMEFVFSNIDEVKYGKEETP